MTDQKTVTGVLRAPGGEVVPGGSITFKLNAMTNDIESGDIILPFETIAVADENGAFSVDLWPNDRGFENTYYTVKGSGQLDGTRLSFEFTEQVQVKTTDDGDFGKLVARSVYVAKGLPEQLTETAIQVAEDRLAAAQSAAQIDPVGMAATLQQQVADGVSAVQAQFDGARVDILSAAAAGHNILPDTRCWDTLCGGQEGVSVPIADAVDGSEYVFDNWGAGARSGNVTVVPYQSFGEFGLPESGEFETVTGSAVEDYNFCALVLDVTMSAPDDTVRLSHFYETLSRHLPAATKSASFFAYVLPESTGDIRCSFPVNWAPSSLGVDDARDGWTYYESSSDRTTVISKFGAQFVGAGRMRLAILLPYARHGELTDRRRWINENGKL